MTDEDLSFDELAESQDEDAAPRRSGRRGRRRGPRRGGVLRGVLPVLLVLLVLVGIGLGPVQGYRSVPSDVSVEQETPDFEEPGLGGGGERVADGRNGLDSAPHLFDLRVDKA